jgi:hypothetical protein
LEVFAVDATGERTVISANQLDTFYRTDGAIFRRSGRWPAESARLNRRQSPRQLGRAWPFQPQMRNPAGLPIGWQ